MELQPAFLESLHGLSKSLDEKVHLLASAGDERLAEIALDVTKQLFDLGVGLEEHSHAQIHPFLSSIAQPSGIQLRSSSSKAKEPSPPPRLDPEAILPHTPLSELTTSGLEEAQVWQQLELRAPGYVKVAKEIVSAEPEPTGMDEMEMEMEEGDSDSDSEGSMTEEDFRAMLEEGDLGDLTDEQIEEMIARAEKESGSEDEDDDDEDSEDDEDEEEDEDDEDESGDEEDEVTFEDGTKIGGSDDEELLEGEDEDEEEEDDEDEEMMEGSDLQDGSGGEEGSADEDVTGEAGPSRRRRHPTLDDQFFSIDDFNRMTEEAEAGKVGGKLDEEDEDLEEDVGQMMLNGADEDDPVMYGDFFDAPRTIEKPMAGKGKGKAKIMKSGGGKPKGKGKGKAVSFDNESVDEEEEEEDEEDEMREAMSRAKDDLFADDDEEEDEEMDNKPLSKFEKTQKALRDQIAQYEQEAIGPKDWTLLGEASARARPENSLLEEDLDFEHVRKVTPVITEESVKTLEDLIKKRILDSNFNSTVRVRAYEPTPFLASRYMELQDTQSQKSLAQIYEDEYQTAATGGKAVDPRDVKLKKDHEEIENLWSDICYKLDALSSLNFVPKQPKAQITTISNLPTTSMETALPASSSASTMLAPEELLTPATQSSLVARSELTPEEAQRLREKKRKAKKSDRKHLGDMADLYGKGNKKGGTKGEKERALQGLVKSGKGVTVVGKDTNKVGDKGKGRKRDGDDTAREDGKRLKL